MLPLLKEALLGFMVLFLYKSCYNIIYLLGYNRGPFCDNDHRERVPVQLVSLCTVVGVGDNRV